VFNFLIKFSGLSFFTLINASVEELFQYLHPNQRVKPNGVPNSVQPALIFRRFAKITQRHQVSVCLYKLSNLPLLFDIKSLSNNVLKFKF
jgi:hypothetical protein